MLCAWMQDGAPNLWQSKTSRNMNIMRVRLENNVAMGATAKKEAKIFDDDAAN
jgi:hypothetical protein